jgi:rod shape-determining protein MreC
MSIYNIIKLGDSMKKIELRYIILIFFIIVAVSLAIVHNSVNQNRKLSYLESVIKDTVLFVNRIVYSPIDYFKKEIEKENTKKDILNKYLELKKEEEKLELNNAKILELETEMETLKSMLELNKTLTKSSYLNATVINRNLGTWYQNITIDKGKNDGVSVDMAVINSKGLVGKVIQTSNFNSTVKLLTSNDLNSKLSVKIKQDTDIFGLLVGYDDSAKAFLISGIDQNTTIELGSVVVTTGMGNIFPSGILVGNVVDIKQDHFGLTKTVYVKPSVSFDDISYVTILRRD